MKSATRAVHRAIVEGQVADLPRIGRRSDQYRAELHAKGLGKLKLASAGMTYGERTARRAHEFIERATTKLEKRIELGYQA